MSDLFTKDEFGHRGIDEIDAKMQGASNSRLDEGYRFDWLECQCNKCHAIYDQSYKDGKSNG